MRFTGVSPSGLQRGRLLQGVAWASLRPARHEAGDTRKLSPARPGPPGARAALRTASGLVPTTDRPLTHASARTTETVTGTDVSEIIGEGIFFFAGLTLDHARGSSETSSPSAKLSRGNQARNHEAIGGPRTAPDGIQ